MGWLVYAFFSAFFNSLMDFFTKLSSGKIHDGLGSFLICLFAGISSLLFIIYSKATGQPIEITKDGFIYSALAGLTVGIATVFAFKMFGSGVNLSVAVPILRIGIILLASTMGVLILKEKISFKLVMGFVLAIAGLYLVIQSKA